MWAPQNSYTEFLAQMQGLGENDLEGPECWCQSHSLDAGLVSQKVQVLPRLPEECMHAQRLSNVWLAMLIDSQESRLKICGAKALLCSEFPACCPAKLSGLWLFLCQVGSVFGDLLAPDHGLLGSLEMTWTKLLGSHPESLWFCVDSRAPPDLLLKQKIA